MKKLLLLFILDDRESIHYVARGPHLCFPCKVVPQFYPPTQAIFDIFGRNMFYLSGSFPTPCIEAESYTDEHGQNREFEFDGEKVIAVFYRVTNFVNFSHRAIDRSRLTPDIFVQFFESHKHRIKKYAA